MFNNPFNRKYQTGGSIDDEGFYHWLKSNVKEFKDYSIEQIKEGVRKMEQTEEGRKASTSLKKSYDEYKKSKSSLKSKFADGGKFQDFICKHKRGGNVDCGCGGMVVRGEKGIDDVPTPKDSVVTKTGHTIYIPTVKETMPNGEVVEITYGHDKDGQWARRIGWSNGGFSVLGGYNNNGKWVTDGDVTYDPASEFARAFMEPKVRMSKYSDRPQSKQEGGELTRKQARILAGRNKGFNRAQFQTAMANADAALRRNTNLRGRDLRQLKRRMVAGLTDAPYEMSNPIEITSPTLTTPSTGLVKREMLIEKPKATQITQKSNKSVYARPEDFPMQNVTIPTISVPQVQSDLNRPSIWDRASQAWLNNGRSYVPSTFGSEEASYAESQPEPIFVNGRFVNASSPEDIPDTKVNTGNNIDWSKQSVWAPYIRMNNGPLSPYQMELIRVLTANPNATINDLRGGWTPETFAAAKQKFGFKCGGKVEKHQQEDGIGRGKLSEKTTRLTGPSIGQDGLGVIRPWLSQTITFNPISNQSDTTYFGKRVNAFGEALPVNITEKESAILPQSTKNKLAKIIDSDYTNYNETVGSYPYGYYEKVIDTKYRK